MRIFILAVFVFCMFSCKDRLEKIGTVPTSPSVKIFYKDSLLKFHRDSVKLTNPNFNYFGVDLRLSDSDRYYTSLKTDFLTGSGNLIYRSDTLETNVLPFSNNRCLLRFVPVHAGISRLLFTVSDQLNNTSTAILELLTFANLNPVASLNLTPVKSVDPLEYLLDASASYDQDRRYGGGIVLYNYQVEGQTISTSKNQIKHIFSAPGVYTITLQVEDNEGGLSQKIIKEVSVN